MRIQILADVGDGLTIPINYNHWLSAAIYHYLARSDGEYADFLHNDGYIVEKKHFKLFTFSQLMARQRRVQAQTIHFGSTLVWYVSSPMERFLSHFADTLLTEGRLFIGPHRLQIQDVRIPRVPQFTSEMRFRCISPIVMSTSREQNGKLRCHYCTPDDAELSKLIRRNLLRKHEAIYGNQPLHDDRLSFRFDAGYLHRKRGRVTRLVDYKGIKIRGTLCPFSVIGSPALIRVGYECGFGDKNSAGFGMVAV